MLDLAAWLKRARDFEHEAHQILSIHETAPSRVIVLEQTYNRLKGLTLAQDDLFRQALRCVEYQLYRAAHVMSWAACMDFYVHKLGSDGFVKLKSVRPKWTVSSAEQLSEAYAEFQLIEAGTSVGLWTAKEERLLIAQLTKRNKCAHPSNFYPDLNMTLGYVSELIDWIEKLQKRPYP